MLLAICEKKLAIFASTGNYFRPCLLLQTSHVPWSVCLCVSCKKTDKPIEMPFGGRTRVGPGNHALDRARMKVHFDEACIRHPLDNVRMQPSLPPDATNSAQQGRHAAAMRAVAPITVNLWLLLQCEELTALKLPCNSSLHVHNLKHVFPVRVSSVWSRRTQRRLSRRRRRTESRRHGAGTSRSWSVKWRTGRRNMKTSLSRRPTPRRTRRRPRWNQRNSDLQALRWLNFLVFPVVSCYIA